MLENKIIVTSFLGGLLLLEILIFGYIYYSIFKKKPLVTKIVNGKEFAIQSPQTTDFYFSADLKNNYKIKVAQRLLLSTNKEVQRPNRWSNFNAYHEFKVLKNLNVRFFENEEMMYKKTPFHEVVSLIDFFEKELPKHYQVKIVLEDQSFDDFTRKFNDHIYQNLKSREDEGLCKGFSAKSIADEATNTLKNTVFFGQTGEPLPKKENLRLAFFSILMKQSFEKAFTCIEDSQKDVIKFYFYSSALFYFAFDSDKFKTGKISIEEVSYNLEFHDFLYFSAITSTTVGYGDIVPASPLSRSIAFFQTLLTYVILALIVARLTS